MSSDDPASQSPRISVVVPFLNASRHLEACLRSLRESEYRDFELIAVDDGSSDGSAAIARRFTPLVVTLEETRGPAFARNRGAQLAEGEILFFTDADVICHADTLSTIAALFSADERLDAVIGSYDDEPPARNFLSRYKNLTHHFVHQHSATEASTFWTGCGAVRRSLFLELGGFDETYRRPSIEDIELGYRMRAGGRRILLCRELLVRHAKVWTLRGLLQSDIFDRAIPWTILQLRYGSLLDDLNVTRRQRVASLMACLAAAGGLLGFVWPAVWLAALGGLAGVVLLNPTLYGFYFRKGGIGFGMGSVGMHLLYYVYSAAAFAAGTILHLASPGRGKAIPGGRR
jgi:GT2 family glycosyltransferase